MSKGYEQYNQLDLSKIGKDILAFWEENNIFQKSIDQRKEINPYTFYEGPPSANGMPGIHHVMARSIKDIFCRYQTLKGKRVERKGGWDTHGLPIELAVEKRLGITKEDIGSKISVEDYNRECKEEVLKYKNEWDKLTQKMGYWVDLENPYITYENNYIESLWWILKQFYDKGFLYKGYTIQPYSPAAGTGLSSHELNQPGCYKDVKDTTIVAQFRVTLSDKSKFLFDDANEDVCFLAWTTTPWTLPSNSALAVGKDIDYVKVKTFNQYTFRPLSVILAKNLIAKHFKPEAENIPLQDYKANDKLIPWQIVAEYKGADLEGIKYEQLLPYVTSGTNEKSFTILLADFVTTEDGTGIVHIAPHFGADDFRVGRESGILPVGLGIYMPLVDRQGKFVAEAGDLAGRYVKEEYYSEAERKDPNFKPTDVRIAIKLKEDNKAFKVEKYEHSYPHCWRTDKPVLYYPLDSWFVKTTAIKDKLVAANKTINWKPEATGTGRFGNWLENVVDWNLSRSRYWGTPLPIWRVRGPRDVNEDPLDVCVGSIAELTQKISFKYNGFHQTFEPLYFDEQEAITEIRGLDLNANTDWQSKRNKAFEDNRDLTKRERFLNVEGKVEVVKKTGLCSLKDYLWLSEEISDLLWERDSLSKGLRPLSIDDLRDLHRPYIDNVVLRKDKQGLPSRYYIREPDLIDVWFDSGAMPYAQWHYPFENKAQFQKAYPADFIAEGVDQTRGWFFTLHTIAVMLNECNDDIKALNQQNGNTGVAFKNVVSNGLVLDKNGNKMSKRLGNAVDPFETIEKYGADATRWYMISNSSPWENLKFSTEGLQETQRKFFGTLYNTYSFFALYANIDKFEYKEPEIPIHSRPEIDRWIISLLNTLSNEVDTHYQQYEPTRATRAIQEFVDEHLSNWYVRLCRRRFWKGDYTEDKISAYQTLYTCLNTIAKLMSPVAPFYSDRLFQDLNNVTKKETAISVHLTDFPKSEDELVDKILEERMALAQNISSLTLSLRKKVSINVRQPLNKILLPVLDEKFQQQVELIKDLILSETNIKQVEYITDTAGFLVKKAKPNFKALGAKVGKDMKEVAVLIAEFNQQQIAEFEQKGSVQVLKYVISAEEIEILTEDVPGWQVASLGKLTVALDTTITEYLKQEGIAREIVNRVQNLRKTMGLDVTDKIKVQLQEHSIVLDAVKNNLAYICGEILATEFELKNTDFDKSIELESLQLGITITKI